jgi:hypothetical protein
LLLEGFIGFWCPIGDVGPINICVPISNSTSMGASKMAHGLIKIEILV